MSPDPDSHTHTSNLLPSQQGKTDTYSSASKGQNILASNVSIYERSKSHVARGRRSTRSNNVAQGLKNSKISSCAAKVSRSCPEMHYGEIGTFGLMEPDIDDPLHFGIGILSMSRKSLALHSKLLPSRQPLPTCGSVWKPHSHWPRSGPMGLGPGASSLTLSPKGSH